MVLFKTDVLIVVIVLTMIGPEARKVDHIKERVVMEMDEDTSSDSSSVKIPAEAGHHQRRRGQCNCQRERVGDARRQYRGSGH